MRRETNYNEVHDAQRYYRLLMDSMARPGKINSLYEMDVRPPAGINKASALLAFSLLNADVSFHHVGQNSLEVTNYLLLNTSSSPTAPPDADFLFLNGADEGNVISEMKTGTLAYPEEGATVVIDVIAINVVPADGDLRITLRGPGVETETAAFVEGLNEKILQRLRDINAEFPLGVDAILTDGFNNLICIPRSNQFSWRH